MRTTRRSFATLILNARNGWQEKLESLEVGTEDYLYRPLHKDVLMARPTASKIATASIRIIVKPRTFISLSENGNSGRGAR